MASRLVTFVYVTDADGVSKVFGPDDEVPAWARKQIVNPKAWSAEADTKPSK